MRSPLPARASYRDLLRDLLARPVAVRQGEVQLLQADRPAYLATFHGDDGVPASLIVTDLSLTTAIAASRAGMAPSQARQRIEEAGELPGELLEALREVADASGRLLNTPSTPYVVLHEVTPVPGDVCEDVAQLAAAPFSRMDWLVTVEGYGEGLVTLLA